MTPAIDAEQHLQKYFGMLLDAYPRRHGAEAALDELRKVLASADDPGQLRACLLDGAKAYEADMRAADQHNFKPLAAFIAEGSWRPEALPFNRMAA